MNLALFTMWCFMLWGVGICAYFLVYPSYKKPHVELWIRSRYTRRLFAVWIIASACLSLVSAFVIGGTFIALGVWLAVARDIASGTGIWVVSGILSILATVIILRWFFPPVPAPRSKPD
ncbi:MAG: hypothetical protein Q7S84_00870 [bacterium]|nr:hypothetical protein [bacterium]